MRVPHGEELAIHTGPESCVDSRKAIGEALTGGVWAGLLSRERYCKLQGADAVHKVEGNTGCIDTRDAVGPCVVRDPGHVHKLLAREPGGPTFGLIVRSAL